MPSGEYPPHIDKPVSDWTEEDFVTWTMTVLERDKAPGPRRATAEAIIDKVLVAFMAERQCSRAQALEVYKSRINVWQGKNAMTDGRHR